MILINRKCRGFRLCIFIYVVSISRVLYSLRSYVYVSRSIVTNTLLRFSAASHSTILHTGTDLAVSPYLLPNRLILQSRIHLYFYSCVSARTAVVAYDGCYPLPCYILLCVCPDFPHYINIAHTYDTTHYLYHIILVFTIYVIYLSSFQCSI
jgi:hypothetical protein